MSVSIDIIRRNIRVLGCSGLLKMLYSVLYEICKKRFPAAANFFLKRRNEILFSYINRLYVLREQITLQKPLKKCDKTIWVFWWQGEDAAPDVIHYCLNSMRKHCAGWSLVVISKDNINEYLNLPDYIINKIGKGISFVQLSDIVRVSLISTYGGGWIDAGMLMTSDLPQEISKFTYFTIKNSYRPSSLISQYRWTGSFMFGKSRNPIISKMYQMFMLYWMKNDCLTEYFLIDYFEAFLYDHDLQCKELIDAVPITNDHLYHDGLSKRWNEVFDEQVYKEITESTWIHRLTYKATYMENPNTFYNRIIKNYI